jgi:hypothetical protein
MYLSNVKHTTSHDDRKRKLYVKNRITWQTPFRSRNGTVTWLDVLDTFVYDCVFCVSITFLPFFIITCLNALIIRKLIMRNKYHRRSRIISEESIIRLEFTIILIAVSFCFVAFNTPYAVVWLTHFINSSAGTITMGRFINETQHILLFTKTKCWW